MKRDVAVEEEETVIKCRCVYPISCDVFEEFSPMDELNSVRDSCGSSVWVLAMSSSVPVVTGILVSPSSVSVLGEFFFGEVLIVSLLNRSPLLSVECVKLSLLKVKEA